MEHPGTQRLSKAVQEASTTIDNLKAFTQSFIKVNKPTLTVGELAKKMKSSNHEAWRKCNDCGDWFDLRKFDCCESCGSKNF